MGGAVRQTRPIVQRGLSVRTGIAVVVVRPVARRAVGVTTHTRTFILVFEKPLRTVDHTEALVQEVMLLTACTKKSFELHVEDRLRINTLMPFTGIEKGSSP